MIGKGGRGIPASRALDHVFGYTIFNDVTARDVQKRHKQFLLGKSLDTFGPMGPWIVTRGRARRRQNTRVRCWVNGELRQDASTRDLIFGIPALIEAISAGITLDAGRLIATGTPGGVGIGFDPPKYLSAATRCASRSTASACSRTRCTEASEELTMANVLFTNARILDGSGAQPYTGEVLVQGNRIARVGRGVRSLPTAGIDHHRRRAARR